MAKCRPTKWLPWALLGAGLPLLAAYMVSTKSLHDDITMRAAGALSANEATAWAKLDNNARDLTINGTAPSQQALDDAIKTVAGTYGVRTVANTVQIVEPIKLLAPTVDSVNATSAMPEIKGTWQEGVATALAVTVAGATYKLGQAPELTSKDGNWLLKLAQPLTEGNYDVTVESSDGTHSMAAAAPGKLVVDLPEPPPAIVLTAPTVKPYFGNSAMPTFTGTWPEVDAKAAEANLEVKVGPTAFALGKAPELTTDGAGNWQLQVKTPLTEGEMDISAALVDKAGAPLAVAAAAAKAIVDLTAPAAPAVMAPMADAKWPYPITGSWAEEKGSTLTAKLQNQSFVVGQTPELTSDGKGNFTFAPTAALAPGSYDVDFTTNDAAGNSVTTTAKAAIVVPLPAPVIVPAAKATIDAIATDAKWPYAITGTWDEKPGNGLTASVSGRTYVLGHGAALTSDGAGKFSFAPSTTFDPGTYDVVFTTSDATSEVKVTVAKAAIVVPAPEPVPAPAPAPEPAPEPVPAPAPKTVLIAPTVASQLDLTGAPIIKGTWPQDVATTLSVAVDGRTYELGKDANLGSKAGNWSLLPGMALKDGTYDVKVSVAAADGATAMDATTNELEVDGTPPTAPTVMTVAANASPDHLSGTWDDVAATALKVAVPQAKIAAALGTANSPLVADGAGKWRLNLAAPLPVGTYNIVVQSTDKHGRTQEDSSEGEVVIAAAGAMVPKPVVFDCQAVMTRIANVFPIRFEYDLTDITRPFEVSVGQYAALLKDPRCMSINVEVQGHADFRGSETYNMSLSERRANVIVGMLKDAGVDQARLTTKGFGESVPLDPAETDEARMKNRRVQITINN